MIVMREILNIKQARNPFRQRACRSRFGKLRSVN